jgi:hypothetical protein
MFNPPTRTGAGQLLHRVNFAARENFSAVYRRRPLMVPVVGAQRVLPTGVSNQYSTPVNVAWTWFYALNKR